MSRKMLSTRTRDSSFLIFSIFTAQISTAAIIDNLDVISGRSTLFASLYYLISLFFAIIQAGFSDELNRKKHLLISSYGVLGANLLLLVLILFSLKGFALPALVFLPCLVLGTLGNAIPIARGYLAVLKQKNIRSLIAITSVCIDLGWITENALNFLFSPMQVIGIALLLQLVSTFFLRKINEVKKDRSQSLKNSFSCIKESLEWLIKKAIAPLSLVGILAYLFSETAFYIPYIYNELPDSSFLSKAQGVSIGIGYMIGVFLQMITDPTDRQSIKIGVTISLISLCFFVITDIFGCSNLNQLTPLDIFSTSAKLCFSIGFGFSVPALFSLMAKKTDKKQIGRLFGVIDSTDTIALGISFGFFSLFHFNAKDLECSIVYSLLLPISLLSATFYFRFLSLIKSRKKR